MDATVGSQEEQEPAAGGRQRQPWGVEMPGTKYYVLLSGNPKNATGWQAGCRPPGSSSTPPSASTPPALCSSEKGSGCWVGDWLALATVREEQPGIHRENQHQHSVILCIWHRLWLLGCPVPVSVPSLGRCHDPLADRESTGVMR